MHPKNDRVLQWARVHYAWVLNQMRGLDTGELVYFIGLFIVDRFGRGLKPSYAYEIAWVFQRDRSTVAKALRILERNGQIKRVNYDPKKRRICYLPRWEDIEAVYGYIKSNYEWKEDVQGYHDKNCPCWKVFQN